MSGFKVFILSFLPFLIGCGQTAALKDDYAAQIIAFRKQKNTEMLGESSPLAEKDRVHFTGLNYYAPDSNFRVKPHFVRYGIARRVEITTNTDRRPVYEEIGEFRFELGGDSFALRAYQIPGEIELFVPFTDLTNGNETYATGRYLNILLPDGGDVVLDFNKAYNPYCAYNSRYSCPIPPASNRLNKVIRAGERKFRK
ncbi:MAG: DUF1684 domain-containing protein [Flavobacteriales bacterium]|nr:DUF1684 domain-containing protein [Flavobacteriales bacterium]